MPRVAMETAEAVHYASAEGGRVAYSAATDAVALKGPGPHVLAALEVGRPEGYAATGSDLYPTLGEFGNLGCGVVWRRYGGSKLLTRDTPETIRNRGGGTRPSDAAFYVRGGFTAELSAKPGKQALVGPGEPYAVPIENVLRPGSCIVWTVEAYLAGTPKQALAGFEWLAALYLEWHELPAAP